MLVLSVPPAVKPASEFATSALTAAASAMQTRDFALAQQQIDLATRFRDEADDIAAAARMAAVYQWWADGWAHVRFAREELRSGTALLTSRGPAIVARGGSRRDGLRVAGGPIQRLSLRIADMPRLAGSQPGAAPRAHDRQAPGFARWPRSLLFDGEVDAAAEACALAYRRGLYVDPLAEEIRDRVSQ